MDRERGCATRRPAALVSPIDHHLESTRRLHESTRRKWIESARRTTGTRSRSRCSLSIRPAPYHDHPPRDLCHFSLAHTAPRVHPVCLAASLIFIQPMGALAYLSLAARWSPLPSSVIVVAVVVVVMGCTRLLFNNTTVILLSS
jgi:hypothetical protein